MSVKISTVERLNANAYDRIIIRETNGNFFVNVCGKKSNDEYVSLSYKLSDRLRRVEDCEKIRLIVDSFLENAMVNCIETDASFYGCIGKFIKICGSRELYLQITNKELLKQLVKMIKDKYERDRYNYLITNDDNKMYNIMLSNQLSSYEKKCISCSDCSGCEEFDSICPKYIDFRLMYNGKILPFDRNFIERFICDKMSLVGLPACVVVDKKDLKLRDGTVVSTIVDGYSISFGDIIIKFTCSTLSLEYILDFCRWIVDKHNRELKEIEKGKKRQLKMEGF